MQLILSGGGSNEKSKGVDSLFTLLLINNRVLYIPIAMNRIKHPYEECLSWLKNSLSQYGEFEITICNEEDLKEITYDDLLSFGGVFIGGGNTYKLLKNFKDSGFDKKLIRLLKRTDVPVIGGSAGALIFAKSIQTAEPYDSNDFGLDDFLGMNLVKGMNIWVHYQESMNNLIEEYVNRLGTKIIALPEDSGLYITDEKCIVVGENRVTIFPGGIEVVRGGNI